MSAAPIIQAHDENILLGITPTGTAPSTTYTLATFLSLNPAARILYGSGSITITWTLGSSLEGAVLVIPCCNLVGAVLTLTNGAGLNVPVPVPTMTRNRIPKSIVLDFSALANRTSGTWNLVIASNPTNVVFGGAVAIYGPKRETSFLVAGFGLEKTAAVQEVKNPYLTRYRQVLRTQERVLKISKILTQAEEVIFSDWYDANFGSGYPSLVWPHPEVNDAFFGTWQETYEVVGLEPNPLVGRQYVISMIFSELSKGQPI